MQQFINNSNVINLKNRTILLQNIINDTINILISRRKLSEKSKK